MYRKRNRAELQEILSPYTVSVCAVYSLNIMLKFFSLFSKHAAKTGLDWRKILSKGLKKLYLLSLSKGKFRGGGSQCVQNKKGSSTNEPFKRESFNYKLLTT